MERFSNDLMEDPSRRERFRAFKEAIKQRVHNIGAAKSTTIRVAHAVEERLYRRFDGDASKVTDDDISKAYDEIDK